MPGTATISGQLLIFFEQTSNFYEKKPLMSQLPIIILAIVSGGLFCSLGCGANSSQNDHHPPITQSNREKDAIYETSQSPGGESPTDPHQQNDQNPLGKASQKATSRNPPTKGAQDSRTPVAPPSGANAGISGAKPQLKSPDVVLQNVSEALAQMRIQLSGTSAGPEVLTGLADLERGLGDLKSVKNQSSTFEISRNLFCAQSDVFSLSLLTNKRIEPAKKDHLESLLQTFHQAGELCGDSSSPRMDSGDKHLLPTRP